MEMIVIDNFVSAIEKAKTVAIVSHLSPDGDTLGAALALYCALKKCGKVPYIFCQDQIPKRLQYLPHHQQFNTQSLDKYDMSVSIDTATYERMGTATEEWAKGKVKCNCDHHITNSKYGDINVIHDCAATCQIMYFVIQKLGVMDTDIATLLMCGLVTDSGIFSYSSVSPETLSVASTLLECGAPLTEICEKVFKEVAQNAFRLKARAMSKAEFFEDGKLVLTAITQQDFTQTDTTEEHTEGIASVLREVEGVDVAIIMSQVSEMGYKVSIRTSEKVNASRIAMIFGGGGHIRAAGCRLNGFLEDVKEKLVKAAVDELCWG